MILVIFHNIKLLDKLNYTNFNRSKRVNSNRIKTKTFDSGGRFEVVLTESFVCHVGASNQVATKKI